MKNKFLLFALFVLAINSYAQSSKKVKNFRIKSTTEWITVYNGEEKSEARKDTYTAFDKDGNTIEKTEFNKDGSIKKKETAKFDSKGNILEEISFDSKPEKDSKESNYKKVTYKYNSTDDKTEENVYDNEGKLIKKTVFTYNRNGDKSAEVSMDASGKVLKKSIYTYDAKGLKAERKTYNGDNALESIKKYEYTY
mgnify:CR=1 FL=1